MESDRDAITGIIGIFSGHRNPELSLTGETVKEFADLMHKTVGKEPIHPPPPARLGYYYGFFIHAPKELAKRFDLPSDFSLYHGVITERKGREKKHWRDVAGVEQFLINQAREQGYGELLEKGGVSKSERSSESPNQSE